MAAGFADNYHAARASFHSALTAFERHSGTTFVRERHVVDAAADLSIDVAELRAPHAERGYVVVSGIHGIEGYAGSAIVCELLDSTLRRLDYERSGLLLVHALNPSGMHQRRRVNARNVDLNRNFDSGDGSLFSSGLGAYETVASLLAPSEPCDPGVWSRTRFIAAVAQAIAGHGFAPLRQATLGGQYGDSRGLFFGGTEREPETRVFEDCFARVALAYPELLLTDLHTGYGAPAQVSSLFARTDSPEMGRLIGRGVRDARGQDQAYAARGDLVGFCAMASKRLRPDALFNGVVVELGTRGLGPIQQLKDLYALVCENQARHYGAVTESAAARIASAFAELFNPQASDWQTDVVTAAVEHIGSMLSVRQFLRAE